MSSPIATNGLVTITTWKELQLSGVSPGSLTLVAPASRDKEVIATKVLETVKRFSIRNGYGFINRNGTKEDIFVHQTSLKRISSGRTFTV